MPDVVDPKATQPGIVGPVTTITPDVVVPPATPPAPPAPPVSAAPVPPAAPASPPHPGPVSIGDDGDIPDDAELLTLSKSALNKRLARATRAELKARFGTDNPDEIKSKLDRLAEFETKQEEQRLASLSELEREREAKAKAEGERDEWKRQHDELRTANLVRGAHSRVSSISGKHFKDTAQKFIQFEFQEYLQGLPEAEVVAMTDEQMDSWFAGEAKTHPELSRGYTPPAPPTPVAPLTNGPPAPEGAPPPTGAGGQQAAPNFAPSAANPMSRQEARKEAAKLGYNY
jgi:hypothetical protein